MVAPEDLPPSAGKPRMGTDADVERCVEARAAVAAMSLAARGGNADGSRSAASACGGEHHTYVHSCPLSTRGGVFALSLSLSQDEEDAGCFTRAILFCARRSSAAAQSLESLWSGAQPPPTRSYLTPFTMRTVRFFAPPPCGRSAR